MADETIQMAIMVEFSSDEALTKFIETSSWMITTKLKDNLYVDSVELEVHAPAKTIFYVFKFKSDNITETCLVRHTAPISTWTYAFVDMVSLFARNFEDTLKRVELGYLYLANLGIYGRFVWCPDGWFMSGADVAVFENTTHELSDKTPARSAVDLFRKLDRVCFDKIPDFYKLGSKTPFQRESLQRIARYE